MRFHSHTFKAFVARIFALYFCRHRWKSMPFSVLIKAPQTDTFTCRPRCCHSGLVGTKIQNFLHLHKFFCANFCKFLKNLQELKQSQLHGSALV